MKKRFLIALGIVASIFLNNVCWLNKPTYANVSIAVSPMHQMANLTPGEIYEGEFTVANTANNDETLYFATEIDPFYVNDNNDVVFEENYSYNEIVNWVDVQEKTGSVAPNSEVKVHYTIDVPQNAPSGGQYVVIRVASATQDDIKNKDDLGVKIDLHYGIGYLIYGNVAGTTMKSGEILETNLPGLLFSENISASSLIRNTGNIHGTASSILQIFPLFSSEEIYTNEESPDTIVILPEKTIYHKTEWEETPPVGIFNVIYTVEFEGVTTQVSKMVIICPIWLLFIIIFAIIMLISYFVVKAKSRKKAAKKSTK